MANKIKYGVKNVYYAVATDDGTGLLTYATPKALRGAVNLTLDAEGESNPFYADNIIYYQSSSNNGYTGSLELALIPDDFRKDVLGEMVDDASVMYEKVGTPTVEFALLFQFEGDEHATRHAMYRCTASRTSVTGATKEASIEPQTETIDLTAMPRINDELVKARCNADSTAYTDWFTKVYEPNFAGEEEGE